MAAFSGKNTRPAASHSKWRCRFGHDPLTFLAGSIEVPYGVPEYEFIGGIRGEPFEMIEGEYSGLPIPANAEIVIEGDVHFDKPTTEGRSASGPAIMPARNAPSRGSK